MIKRSCCQRELEYFRQFRVNISVLVHAKVCTRLVAAALGGENHIGMSYISRRALRGDELMPTIFGISRSAKFTLGRKRVRMHSGINSFVADSTSKPYF